MIKAYHVHRGRDDPHLENIKNLIDGYPLY